MTRINPFDDYYFKQKIGENEGINSSQKVDKQKNPVQIEGQGNTGNFAKSDENDFVDLSSMVDDSNNFNSSNFNFEDKSNEINSENTTEEAQNDSNNQNNSNEDEIKEEINHFVNELLEKNN